MKPSRSLVVVGSVALDSVETRYGRRDQQLGGAAVYCSLAARHFASPNIIGVVGDDFPDRHVQLLRRRKIGVEGIQRRPGTSFRWAGRYSADGNTAHTLDTQLGVFADFRPTVPNGYAKSPVLFLANIDPSLQLSVLEQMPGALVGGDTMNFWIEGKRSELDRVMRKLDLIFVNEHESRLLTGEHNLLNAAAGLLKLGPRVAVVKKGEHGAMIRTANDILYCPPFPVKDVRDPTGAGDSFAGAFMGTLARLARPKSQALDRRNLARACAAGSVVASFTVQEFGVKGLLSMSVKASAERLKQLKRFVSLP